MEPIDKSSLEKELTTAFVKDATRKAEDSMKKRAILTARSYDEFRHLVAAATQKPIDKADITRKAEVSANKSYLGTTSNHIQRRNDSIGFGISLSSSSSSDTSTINNTEPKLTMIPTNINTRSDIEKAWRRLPKSTIDRYNYLLSLGCSTIENVFKFEIDCTLLGNFLFILGEGLKIIKNNNVTTTSTTTPDITNSSSSLSSSLPTDHTSSMTYENYVSKTCALLISLSKGGQFDFVKELLSKNELYNVQYIMEQALVYPILHDNAKEIGKLYGIKLE